LSEDAGTKEQNYSEVLYLRAPAFGLNATIISSFMMMMMMMTSYRLLLPHHWCVSLIIVMHRWPR